MPNTPDKYNPLPQDDPLVIEVNKMREPMPNTPSWREKLKEEHLRKFFEATFIDLRPYDTSDKDEEKIDWWLDKIDKTLSQEREKAYDEGAAEATMVCNEKTIPLAIAKEKESLIERIKRIKPVGAINGRKIVLRFEVIQLIKEK